MVGQLINQTEPKNNAKSLADDLIKPGNLDEIMKYYPRAYETWTTNEDQQLTIEFEQGKSVPQIAIVHQRQTGTIRSRLKELGLISE